MINHSCRNILIVDDDDDILTIIKYCFEQHPEIHIRCVNSGEKAIKEALNEIPDLIILDVMMPKPDGIEVLKVLKTIPKLTKVPIMFLTAKVQAQEVEYYYRLGVFFVLIKPFDPDTFVSIITDKYNQYCKQAS